MYRNPLLKLFLVPGILALAFILHSAFPNNHPDKKTDNATAPNIILQTDKKFACFLAMADTHIDTSRSRSRYGRDAGIDLWQSTIDEIKELIKTEQPKFIVLLGDLPWHANRSQETELISARGNAGFILGTMRSLADSASIPLLYVPGNNDSWGGDYDAFTVQGKKVFDNESTGLARWPMINTSPASSDKLASIADSSLMRLGCYSVYPIGKKSRLRVVVLNSTIFVNRKQDYSSNAEVDSRSEISWLKNQLESVDALNEFSLVVMHVPPGKESYWRNSGKDLWSADLHYNNTTTIQDAFMDLAVKYQKRIIGFLSSHTHLDGIKILTDRCKNFSNFFISVPSVSPDHRNNPALKVITYDSSTHFRLMDFTTYYNPLNESGPTNWSNSYNFTGSFKCPPGTSIQSYLKLSFSQTNTSVLKTYLKAIYSVKSPEINDQDNDMEKLLMIYYQRKQCMTGKN